MEDVLAGFIFLLPIAVWLGRRAVRLVVVSFYATLGFFILIVLGLLFGGCSSADRWSSWQWMEYMNQKTEKLAEQLIVNLPGEKTPKIAVLDFPNLEGKVSQFGTFLSEELTTAFFKSGRVWVVERKLLEQAEEELKKNQSPMIAEENARHIGKQLGAEMIVIGTITEFINVLRVNARMIDVETGAVWSAAATTFPYHFQLKSGRSYRLNH